MANSFDFKKEYKDLYIPPRKPVFIDVPEITCIAVDGSGNPNTCEAYKEALELLYGFSYSIKMSKMNGTQPEGYFNYVVPPLEGFWTVKDMLFDGTNSINKDCFEWTSFIRQPEFVTEKVFEEAKIVLRKKKPELNLEKAKLIKFTEGYCAQILHIGPYDTEPEDIKKMSQFVNDSGYTEDFETGRRHHEIYLSDPRKTAPLKLRTVVRHPVKKI